MLSALQTAYKLQSHHEIDIYLMHISLLDSFFVYNHFILSDLKLIHFQKKLELNKMNGIKLNVNCALGTALCNTPCPRVAAA